MSFRGPPGPAATSCETRPRHPANIFGRILNNSARSDASPASGAAVIVSRHVLALLAGRIDRQRLADAMADVSSAVRRPFVQGARSTLPPHRASLAVPATPCSECESAKTAVATRTPSRSLCALHRLGVRLERAEARTELLSIPLRVVAQGVGASEQLRSTGSLLIESGDEPMIASGR
jgi:hypothetical protein